MLIKDDKICKRVMENLGEIIDQGGYGYIYSMRNDEKLVAKITKENKTIPPGFDINVENRCISGKGCSDDIILEGLIMEKLNSLNSKHFVSFKGLYKCNNQYILLMEKLNGISYKDFLKQNINYEIKLQILFQITYALYISNTKLNFVHGDLISKNIMIENVKEEDYEYIIDNKKIYVPNMRIRVVIFDFGFSRINYKGWKFYQQHYKNDDELFDGTADICKVYNNPTMVLPEFFDNIMIKGVLLKEILKSCKTTGWSYIPVPPFPKLKAIDILRTDLFDELYKNKVSYKSFSLNSLNKQNYGMEPIQNDIISINDWLSENKDNFTLYVPDNDLPFCLKKSYFIQPQTNDIFVKCFYKNKNLLKKESYNSNEYRNIGYYFNKKYLVDNKDFQKIIEKDSNIFKLELQHKDKFILKEALLLSSIEIGYKDDIQNFIYKRLNVGPHDAYFEQLYINALNNYSYQWDGTINRYLMYGEQVFEEEWFLKNYLRFVTDQTKTQDKMINEAKENIKKKIEYIDKCFLDFAPRFENSFEKIFRGMKTEYIKDMKIGDSFEIKNYISTSSDIKVAKTFSDEGKQCCIYEFEVDNGIPYINMVTSTKYTSEEEILLPRGLIATCIKYGIIYRGRLIMNSDKIDEIKKKNKLIYMNYFKLKLSMKSEDQFNLSDICRDYTIVNIKPDFSKSSKSPVKSKSPKLCQFKNKNIDLSKEVKKCPNGCVKNKKTKLCEPSKSKSPPKSLPKSKSLSPKAKSKSPPKAKSPPKSKSPPKAKSKSPKLCKFKNKNMDLTKEVKKCPNGCVKNKKTKLCEPKAESK